MALENFTVTPVIAIDSDSLSDAFFSYPISAPARAWITKIQVVELGGADFVADFFNRGFNSDPHEIAFMSEGTDGKIELLLKEPLGLVVGDQVNLTGCGNNGYNGDWRVLELLGPKTFLLDLDFTVRDNEGTLYTNPEENEEELYKVISITGTDGLGVYDDPAWLPLINADPLPKGQSSKTATSIHFRPDAAGDYRVSLTFVKTS